MASPIANNVDIQIVKSTENEFTVQYNQAVIPITTDATTNEIRVEATVVKIGSELKAVLNVAQSRSAYLSFKKEDNLKQEEKNDGMILLGKLAAYHSGMIGKTVTMDQFFEENAKLTEIFKTFKTKYPEITIFFNDKV